MCDDIEFMNRALLLAREALEDGEVPVGAVIVRDGKVISEGRNRREKTQNALGHAEIEAIDKACRVLGNWRLADCTLYVTLEPCPMCAGAILQSRIGRIVYACKDPSLGALGGLFSLPENSGQNQLEITSGLLESECREIMDSFFCTVRHRNLSRRLQRDFYLRDAETVAKEMLGKYLCFKSSKDGTQTVAKVKITETEAYLDGDSAAHAYHGETDRNRPMFGKGGTVYVYLCYGIHSLLNIVTGEKGSPQAVLIRGIEGYYGPGKLTKALGIDRKQNNADAVLSDVIWLEDSGEPAPAYTCGKRIGIDYALPEDRDRLLRFTVTDM